jgi:hypothetical protein
MTAPAPDHLYRRLTDNARAVSKGLVQAERVHKEAIRSGQDPAVQYAARMHQLTVGLLAESLLRKTVADPAGFNDRERSLLGQERSQISRWRQAVSLGFRRQYSVAFHLDVDETSTSQQIAAQFRDIDDLLENELTSVIGDRNKIAHGQWAWLLNSNETLFTGRAAAPLNYRAIEARSKLVEQITAVIADLVVSEPTFARDYQARYRTIQQLRLQLTGPDYPALVRQLRSRRRRG